MSREPRSFTVLGFGSVHDSLQAEAVLRDLGIAATPIPSPRELGELCGVALRIDPADAERAERLLSNAGMAPLRTAEIEDL